VHCYTFIRLFYICTDTYLIVLFYRATLCWCGGGLLPLPKNPTPDLGLRPRFSALRASFSGLPSSLHSPILRVLNNTLHRGTYYYAILRKKSPRPHRGLPSVRQKAPSPPVIGSLGERCEIPQRGSGRSPDHPKVFHYFQHSKWHLLTL